VSDVSKIEWTDATWNPTTGCTRVSAGCDHCYIETTPPFRIEGRRFDKPGIGGKTGVRLHPDRLDKPLHWRKPRRVFVNSLSDLFHDDIPDEFIADVFAVMALSPLHTFQVLTKRPRRMQTLLTSEWWADFVRDRAIDAVANDPGDLPPLLAQSVLPNVWLGVSVENQEWADKRVPLLLETPAAVRFLSCEPLLGPVDLTKMKDESGCQCGPGGEQGLHEPWCGTFSPLHEHAIDWVIVGGESGPKFRPLNLGWARSLRDQCVAVGVPFFFKQVGGIRPKSGGRELDGRTWDEMPTPTQEETE